MTFKRKNSDYDEVNTLLTQISYGEETALKKLFDIYYQRLFHFALYFLKSKECAEEVVSDVFFILWRKKELLEQINNFDNYLYIVVKNQSLQYLKRNRTHKDVSTALYQIEWISDCNNPESKLLEKELEQQIQQAIESLPEKCREVFRLFLSDKLKQREIAELLNISIKTVEAHVSTAYKRISQSINKMHK